MTVAEIPGVAITEDAIGNLNQITINLKEHPEAIPVLKNLGLIPKTQFDVDFEEGYTLEELESHLTNIVKKHYADKHKTAGL